MAAPALNAELVTVMVEAGACPVVAAVVAPPPPPPEDEQAASAASGSASSARCGRWRRDAGDLLTVAGQQRRQQAADAAGTENRHTQWGPGVRRSVHVVDLLSGEGGRRFVRPRPGRRILSRARAFGRSCAGRVAA